MSVEPPDRVEIVAAVMPDVLRLRVDTDDQEVGAAQIICDEPGTCAGMPIVKEIVGRVGARARALVAEGALVEPGQVVAELGGPRAAIGGAAPLALRWLHRLSAVASGAIAPEPGDALDTYASRLSASGAVRHDGPAFHMEFEE